MPQNGTPFVLVIGAASIDTKGRAGHPLQTGTSTPGAIRMSVGGVGRNVAENLARLGERVVLLTAVGDDQSGQLIMEQAQAHGIDVSQMLVSREYRTASYLALLDETGDLVMSIDDMKINQKLITPQYLYRRRRFFRDAQLVVLDANLSAAALRTLFRLAAQYRKMVCADPTTAMLAPRLCPHLTTITLITPNAREAEALCGVQVQDRDSALTAARRLREMGVQIAIVTLGASGAVYATSEESGHLPAVQTEVVDLTGAGDALTAAVVFGLVNDVPIAEAVRLGISAAALTLQCRDTVCPTLSLEHLYDQLVL
jgi:pseudouridine kinase